MTWNIHDLKPRRTGSAPLRSAPRAVETRAPSHSRSIFETDDDDAYFGDDSTSDEWNLEQMREAKMAGILSPRQWNEWGRHMRRGIDEV